LKNLEVLLRDPQHGASLITFSPRKLRG